MSLAVAVLQSILVPLGFWLLAYATPTYRSSPEPGGVQLRENWPRYLAALLGGMVSLVAIHYLFSHQLRLALSDIPLVTSGVCAVSPEARKIDLAIRQVAKSS